MAKDERALRQLLHHSAVSFEPLDGAALRAAAERGHSRRGRRFVLPAAVAVSVVAIAVAASVIAHPTSPTPRTPGAASTAVSTRSTPSGPSGPSRVDTGSNAADGSFQVRLVLPARSFPANGQPIHAYVLVINRTGRPVTIYGACNGWVQAGLSGGPAIFGITTGDVACPIRTMAPGTTRIETTILTTFTQCQQGGQPGTPEFPHCLGPDDSRFPNLPAGDYFAEVKTQGASVPPVLSTPQPVTLTPTR